MIAKGYIFYKSKKIFVKEVSLSEAKLLKSVKIRPSKPNSPLGDLLSSVLSRQQAFLLHEHQVVALTRHLAQYN